MTFIQIVSFHCADLAALRDIEDEWLAATEGRRTSTRAVESITFVEAE